MSSTCFKDETPTTDVTTNIMDESAESDNFSDSDHELDDTSSVEDQKVTAVIAVIELPTAYIVRFNTERIIKAYII